MSETKTTVNVDSIKEFIDGFSKINKDSQLVLLGILKGMVAVNDIQALNTKGA